MEDQYIVKYGDSPNHYCDDQDFQEIGNWEAVEKWLENRSLEHGDEIYKIELVAKVKSETTLKLQIDLKEKL